MASMKRVGELFVNLDNVEYVEPTNIPGASAEKPTTLVHLTSGKILTVEGECKLVAAMLQSS